MDEEYLIHYGTPRHSGRYPWGSGGDPYQHEQYFRKTVDELSAKGMSEKDIMTAMGMSTTEFRAMKSISKAQRRAEDQARVLELKDKGYSNIQIGKMMTPPRNESSVRALLDPSLKERNDLTYNTAAMLKSQLTEKGGYLDIGDGVEREIGVSQTKLATAAKMLEMEGYEIYNVPVEQVTNKGKYTIMKVLAPPGATYDEIYKNLDKVNSVKNYTVDDGKTFYGIEPPKSLDSGRIMIRYGDEGGIEKDGVIELRRGVEDISLGNSSYAQVRIAVDGTHYLKGMAIYSDDMPAGTDVIFNTNKDSGTAKTDVFKKLKDDPDNPFGATIKAAGQRHYTDGDGTDQLSVINKVNEEGDWSKYSKTLSSQFLSKQNYPLVKRQLDLSYSEKLDEFNTICALTNPAVRKKLLKSFSEGCDSSAVHLKAASLPRQTFQVILPIPSMKDGEIFAPNYRDGEEVVLIRYPHGGTFEIPRLKVNNKQSDAVSIIGKLARDAVGINSHVAEQLSGADFDGDTVLVIPVNDKVKIKTSQPLLDLKGFNPREQYKGYEGMKVISDVKKQTEMGKVSNLITDMTLQGAPTSEIARAVKHSMVVIDSEKHKLDWQRSERENGIAELKERYQNGGGAATLISRAKSEERVPERKLFSIDRDTDPATGEKIYRETGRKYVKGGKTVEATVTSTKMGEARDANDLVSSARTPIERAYADYANRLKALANSARKEYLSTPNTETSPTAKKTYAFEVASLKARLNEALKNRPKERQAQLTATQVIRIKKKDNPDMEKAEEKKARQQALAAARTRFGASSRDSQISISDREWEAIQAGAISNNILMSILDNTDLDAVKQRAMPRDTGVISGAKQARIRNMASSGYTSAEIAEAVGVSPGTVAKYI